MHPSPDHPASAEHVEEIDLLISRLVDGEADEAALARFDALTRSDPASLRRLAEAQRDFVRLAGVVAGEVAAATSVSVSPPQSGKEQRAVIAQIGMVSRLHLVAAYSGWAAAILLGIFIAMWKPEGEIRDRAGAAADRFINLEEAAPFILEEREGKALDPVLIFSEQMPDGRWRIMLIDRTMREIIVEEFQDAWIEERPADPADANGGA